MVKYLVEKHGCDPTGKDDDGNTSLHLAAAFGSLEMVMYLIEDRKINPECPDGMGRSPLHNACELNLAIVKYLVEKHGCDIYFKDSYGLTPLDLAATSNETPVITYLKERFGLDTGNIEFVSLLMNMLNSQMNVF